jgi:WD40 repeat protein
MFMPDDLPTSADFKAQPTIMAGTRPASPPGYELLEEIGHGGMGTVYRARDRALDRDVAVKLLSERYPADSPAAQRFLSEARITGQLQHPGIPAVHQVGALADGRPFLAMKLIKGSTLESILKLRTDPAANRGRLLAIFEVVCQAVGYAHAHRVIHRDLKPGNVMVGTFGEVQVMDWGVAKVLGEETPSTADALAAEQTQAETKVIPTMDFNSQTQAGSLVGTPAFIAPEQAVGQIDRVNERSDVFGLGAVLAVILTGKPPYVGDSFEAVRVQAVRGNLDDCFDRLNASGAEPELVALCKQCLAFEPANRPADAGEVAAAVAGLRAAADERARRAELERVRVEGEQATAAARSAERRKRRRLVIGAAAVLAVAAVGGLLAVLAVQRRANADLADKNTLLKIEQAKVEDARKTAVKEAADATTARRDLGLTLADSYTTLGLVAGERNDPAGAALWFARAVRQSEGDPEREFYNRIRYRNWAAETFTPVAGLRPTPLVYELALHPTGRFLATRSGAGSSVWDLEHEAQWVPPTGFESSTALSWNADGSRIALAAPDQGKTARVGVFEFPSGKVVRERKTGGPVSVVRFSPDGRTLAVGGREAEVWNPDEDQLTTLAIPDPSQVQAIEFAPDGKRLVTQSGGAAHVFDLTGQKAATPIRVTPHTPATLYGSRAQFAAGGSVLVTYSDSTVRGIDVATGKARFEHRPSHDTNAFTVSPDGQTVWVGQGENGQGVEVLAVADGSLRPVILPHTNSVHSIVFTADGRTVVTASLDRTLCVWDTATGRRRFPPLAHSQMVQFVACTPDGRTIASKQNDSLLRVWRLPAGVPARTLEPGGEYTLARFAAGGRYLVPTSGAGIFPPQGTLARLQLYDPATGAPAAPAVTPGGLVLDADVSPDGRLLVTGSASRAKSGDRPTIRVWDVKSGEPVGKPIPTPSEPRSVRFLANRGEVAVLCAGGQLLLLDPTVPRLKNTMTQPAMAFRANQYTINGRLRYLPEERRILIFGPVSSEPFWVCDPEALTLSPIRGKNLSWAYDVMPSPDGRVWAVSSQSNDTTFLAVKGGSEPAPPLVHPDWAFSARFNRAGDRLLTASRDGVARLWDWRTGKLLVAYRHADEIPAAEFLPDERFLVSASFDGTLRVWGAATGEPVAPPVRLGGKGLCLDVTPDGRFAVASGFSRHVTVADLADVTIPTRADADELDLRAELASNQRITPSGGLAYLTTEEWLARWREHRRRNSAEKDQPEK